MGLVTPVTCNDPRLTGGGRGCAAAWPWCKVVVTPAAALLTAPCSGAGPGTGAACSFCCSWGWGCACRWLRMFHCCSAGLGCAWGAADACATGLDVLAWPPLAVVCALECSEVGAELLDGVCAAGT